MSASGPQITAESPRSMPARSARALSPIGPHSRRIALGKLDGRRREARLMREISDELTAHVGGSPNAVQRSLIARAAALHLRLSLMDAAVEPGGIMSEKNAREYVCWNNAFVRTVARLGMLASVKRQPDIREIMAERAAGRTTS